MIFLYVYIALTVLAFRPMFRLWMEIMCYSRCDWGDISALFFICILTVGTWPLFLIGCIVKNTIGQGDPNDFAKRMAGRTRRQKLEMREKSVGGRERKIEQLERELSIR